MSAEKVTQIYKLLATTPALKDARISNGGALIQSLWSQRNADKLKVSKFSRSFLYNNNVMKKYDIDPVDTSTELLSQTSPSEKFRACVRDSDDRQFLEIWTKKNLHRSVDLTTLDVHGKVYTEPEFASLKWSADESKVLYVAEKKPAKSEPFYVRKSKKSDEKIEIGKEFRYEQDWGEQMVEKKRSVVVEYQIEADTVDVLELDELHPGQVNYFKDGSIYGVTYDTSPRKLGLIYCVNRPSRVFTFCDGKIEYLSAKGRTVQTPMLAPDGDLVWLEGKSGGPHRATASLVKKNLKTGLQTNLIDVVDTELRIENEKTFYGLYHSELVNRCFASDDRLLFSSVHVNTFKTYVVDIRTRKITELPFDGSQILLDVKDDLVLVNRRNFLRSDALAIAKLPAKGNEDKIQFMELTDSQKIPLLEECICEDLTLTYDSEEIVKTFSAIYVGPTNPTALVVYPHGGPHSAFTHGFSLDVAMNLSMNFSVLMVNYRGSLGYGDKTIHYLLGRVGNADVSDCIFATDTALARYQLDQSKVVLAGGSHGGFLVTHLSGQHPDRFRAVVARNAVIDIASMSITSDIPDWCYVECGEEYSQEGAISNETLLKMRNASPIVHAHKVKAPTLLQVGSKDLRVPPHQSYDYYHRLKANGVKVEMNLYDDSHPLGSVKNEMDNLINSMLWFQQHVSK